MMDPYPNENLPRRSLRRLALTEISPLEASIRTVNITENPETPTSPDELVIVQRGRRRQPLTWSPVEYSKTNLLDPPRDKTPERTYQKLEVNSKLRRRLTMSPPGTNTTRVLGKALAKKLKTVITDKDKS